MEFYVLSSFLGPPIQHEIVHPAQTICDHLKSIQFDGLIFCLTSEVFKSLLRDAGFKLVEEVSD